MVHMPEPTSPIIEGYEDQEVVYAKNQPQYKPLPVLQSKEGSVAVKHVVLSRWKPTPVERAEILAGADIFLYVWTGGGLLQPISIEVGECTRSFAEMAHFLGREKDEKHQPSN